jgi:hypothetical protein
VEYTHTLHLSKFKKKTKTKTNKQTNKTQKVTTCHQLNMETVGPYQLCPKVSSTHCSNYGHPRITTHMEYFEGKRNDIFKTILTHSTCPKSNKIGVLV